MFAKTLAVSAALLSMASATSVQVVNVGWNPANNATGLKYWPENIKAEAGTMVQFHFWNGNHTVTQSNFDNPCKPLTKDAEGKEVAAIKSGFMPVEESAPENMIPVFTVQINDTKPLWFYCGQGPHCQKGMSMVINENTTKNATRSLIKYKELAAGLDTEAPKDQPPTYEKPGYEKPGYEAPPPTEHPAPEYPAPEHPAPEQPAPTTPEYPAPPVDAPAPPPPPPTELPVDTAPPPTATVPIVIPTFSPPVNSNGTTPGGPVQALASGVKIFSYTLLVTVGAAMWIL